MYRHFPPGVVPLDPRAMAQLPLMRFVYGAPDYEQFQGPPPVGPPPDWGPPNPVFMPQLAPLPGHPTVWCFSAQVSPNEWGIHCECHACGGVEDRRCEFPPKSGSWIARFAALHHHGNQAVRDAWEREYHVGLHRLRAAHPGAP